MFRWVTDGGQRWWSSVKRVKRSFKRGFVINSRAASETALRVRVRSTLWPQYTNLTLGKHPNTSMCVRRRVLSPSWWQQLLWRNRSLDAIKVKVKLMRLQLHIPPCCLLTYLTICLTAPGFHVVPRFSFLLLSDLGRNVSSTPTRGAYAEQQLAAKKCVSSFLEYYRLPHQGSIPVSNHYGVNL